MVPHDKAERFLHGLADAAEIISIPETLAVCTDPGDNCFLETALIGNAEYVVTKNIKHFPWKKYQDVKIVRVSNFLSLLEGMYGEME